MKLNLVARVHLAAEDINTWVEELVRRFKVDQGVKAEIADQILNYLKTGKFVGKKTLEGYEYSRSDCKYTFKWNNTERKLTVSGGDAEKPETKESETDFKKMFKEHSQGIKDLNNQLKGL